ncbi:MAG: hypothetical protein Q8R16_00725 [bacterium]|nr:hypothetical protein [bacterium]
MSDYRREQLLTYVSGPLLMAAGLLMLYFGARCLVPHGKLSVEHGFAWGAFVGMTALAHVLYGAYIIRAGRNRLASDHWRAEHYVP